MRIDVYNLLPSCDLIDVTEKKVKSKKRNFFSLLFCHHHFFLHATKKAKNHSIFVAPVKKAASLYFHFHWIKSSFDRMLLQSAVRKLEVLNESEVLTYYALTLFQ